MIPSISQITKQWKREGRTFRPGDVADEWKRLGQEELTRREDEVLAAAGHPNATFHTREVANQIRERRECVDRTDD